MLKSFQALYDHGRLTWLTDKPSVEEAHVIVTLLSSEVAPALKAKRQTSPRIDGQEKFQAISSRQLRLLRIGTG